jgi:hypothetical protein
VKVLSIHLENGDSLVVYRAGQSDSERAAVKNEIRRMRIERRKKGLGDVAGSLELEEVSNGTR